MRRYSMIVRVGKFKQSVGTQSAKNVPIGVDIFVRVMGYGGGQTTVGIPKEI